MEMGVREWIIVVAVLLVGVALFNLYRNLWGEHRKHLRVVAKGSAIEGDDYNPELPNGGARVVGPMPQDHEEVQRQEPFFDLDEKVQQPLYDDHNDPLFGQSDVATVGSTDEPVEPESPEEAPLESDALSSEVTDDAIDRAIDSELEPMPRWEYQESTDSFVEESEEVAASHAEDHGEHEVVVINVMARADQQFAGEDLVKLLLACDLRFGEMNIFHRYEEPNGDGAKQFSLVNSVEPGVFDLDALATFSTPGVTLFMQLPGPRDSMQAFNCMVEVAQCIVSNLGGEMRDERHSAMTVQTLEHCRQRIQEFERRKLATHADR